MFLDIVKLGVRFLPEKPEGRFYVAKNRLYSHHLSFLCDKPGKQLPCLHEQIFAGQVQRAAKQRAVRYRRNREAEPKRLGYAPRAKSLYLQRNTETGERYAERNAG